MKANRSVCRSFVVIIQPQRWSCRKHVSIINRNGSHAESTLSLFDLNVGFTTNMLPISNRNVGPPASTLPIVDRNSGSAANMLPISDRKVRRLYIPFSGSASNNCRHCIVGSESGQNKPRHSSRYPNERQNTPTKTKIRRRRRTTAFFGCTEKTANGTRIITDREVRFSFSYNFSSRQKRYCPHHAIHEERFWKFPYRK